MNSKCVCVAKSKNELEALVCYYCGSAIAAGEEIVNRDSKLYHKECFTKILALTITCLTCREVTKCFA